jgi:hypothetical protein
MPRKMYVEEEKKEVVVEGLKDVPTDIEKTDKIKRAKKTKVKGVRKPSAYNEFVKKHMATDKVKKLNHRDRMKYVAAIWKEHKEKK